MPASGAGSNVILHAPDEDVSIFIPVHYTALISQTSISFDKTQADTKMIVPLAV